MKKRQTYLKNLDTGMRRLGFLEVLMTDCVRNASHDHEDLGQRLWSISRDKQDEWLRLLGENRGLNDGKKEVGHITERISERYVKLATELGFVTKGFPKILTDDGLLFKMMRGGVTFFLTPGQKIVYLKKLLQVDSFITPYLIEKISKEKRISKGKIIDWFCNDCIAEILKNHRQTLNDYEADRLRKTSELFNSGRKDSAKHMVDTRLEQLVDLDLISKDGSCCQYTKTSTIFVKYVEKITSGTMDDDEFYKMVSEILGIKRKASKDDILQSIVEEFDKIAMPPTYLVSLATLQGMVCIKSIVDKKSLALPSHVKEAEKKLSKQYYGKVVLFEGRTAEKAYITIPVEVKKQILGDKNRAQGAERKYVNLLPR